MRKAQGYGFWTDASGKVIQEVDTFTCNHCNTVVYVKPASPPEEAGGFCRICMKCICGRCADLGRCVPFEKKLEAMEKRAHATQRFHEAIGTQKK